METENYVNSADTLFPSGRFIVFSFEFYMILTFKIFDNHNSIIR